MDDENKIPEELSAYLDGELSPEQAGALEARLERDASLAAALAGLRKTRELLHSLPRLKADEDFASAVLEKAERQNLIGRSQHSGAKWLFSWTSLAAAAVMLAAATAGLIVILQLSRTESFEERMARKGASTQLSIPTAQAAAPKPEVESDKPPGPELAMWKATEQDRPVFSNATTPLYDGAKDQSSHPARPEASQRAKSLAGGSSPAAEGLAELHADEKLAQQAPASGPTSAPSGQSQSLAMQRILTRLGLGRIMQQQASQPVTRQDTPREAAAPANRQPK
ncbi:MAG: hypothetical protein WC869_01390 [Phycisphaerae bacterium]|jgi:hypothetical protein